MVEPLNPIQPKRKRDDTMIARLQPYRPFEPAASCWQRKCVVSGNFVLYPKATEGSCGGSMAEASGRGGAAPCPFSP